MEGNAEDFFSHLAGASFIHHCLIMIVSVADLRGSGSGGLTPPPPLLGLPSKNLMCIEKRHHNMSRPTQYITVY